MTVFTSRKSAPERPSSGWTRREALLGLLAGSALAAAPDANTRQATGLRIGEVTPDSAVIWARRTKAASRLNDGLRRWGHAPNAATPKPGEDVSTFEGACPGESGYIQLEIEPAEGPGAKRTLDWTAVEPGSDFVHQFRIAGLSPATYYKFAVKTRAAKDKAEEGQLTGSFYTAPVATGVVPVRFAVTSCQMYCRQDREDGFWIYESLDRLRPDFFVSCGDNVYYDSEDPIVNSVPAARYHWHRMYSLPTLRQSLVNVAGYWQKDDHDLLSDDCWPGMKTPKMQPFSFEQGREVFREQSPAPPAKEPYYRTARWGALVEVWMPEAREYRDPNTAPDGPGKSIWGEKQLAWLQKSLVSSDAKWKIIVNPNPMVGPDHARKNDNHANPAFAYESQKFRKWLRDNVGGQVFLMNGDRHWQYHSVDPETGLHEFGCGPASDIHAVPPSRGEDPAYHRFLRVKGGFVMASVDSKASKPSLVIEHREVRGEPVHRAVFPQS